MAPPAWVMAVFRLTQLVLSALSLPIIRRAFRPRKLSRVINERADSFAGIEVEIKEREQGPPQGKGIEIEVSGQNLSDLTTVTTMMTQYMQSRDDLYIDVENTLPLPVLNGNFERRPRGCRSLLKPISLPSVMLSNW